MTFINWLTQVTTSLAYYMYSDCQDTLLPTETYPLSMLANSLQLDTAGHTTQHRFCILTLTTVKVH